MERVEQGGVKLPQIGRERVEASGEGRILRKYWKRLPYQRCAPPFGPCVGRVSQTRTSTEQYYHWSCSKKQRGIIERSSKAKTTVNTNKT